MAFFYKFRSWDRDSLEVGLPLEEPLLKPSLLLRYDRAHAGSAAKNDVPRPAAEPTPAGEGEAHMDVPGPGFANGATPEGPSDSRPRREEGSPDAGIGPLPADAGVEAALIQEPFSRDPRVRAERLARIRAEIAAGTYETADKLERAVEQLLRDVR